MPLEYASILLPDLTLHTSHLHISKSIKFYSELSLHSYHTTIVETQNPEQLPDHIAGCRALLISSTDSMLTTSATLKSIRAIWSCPSAAKLDKFRYYFNFLTLHWEELKKDVILCLCGSSTSCLLMFFAHLKTELLMFSLLRPWLHLH